jgi:Nuclease-related domain/AAA domain
MPTIIPASGLNFKGAGGDAERRTLEALKGLPEDYYVIRECSIVSSRETQKSGQQREQPDFIVVGPELGILVLEVKDWNIINNTYDLLGQYKIKVTRRDGTQYEPKHPWRQAESYKYALKGLLPESRLWITHAVVFPKLTSSDFKNRFDNPYAENPQSDFILNLKETLFRGDIIAPPDGLLTRLQHYVNSQRPTYYSPLQYTREQVQNSVEILLPSEMRVGGLPDHNESEQQLKILDEEQQKWAIGTNYADKKYLIDVAGSGKTNVLLSRAIHLAKKHYDNGGCRILITTYNTALKNELSRILSHKIVQDPLVDYYNETIAIKDIISIMEDILQNELAEDFQQWKAAYPEQKYIDEILPNECRDILEKRMQDFAIYDYLLIDEIQDFSTRFIHVATSLLKNKQNLFVVGDIGQKLFDRTIEWWDIDMGPERVSLPRRFLMYRSPQPIAKLAWKFLISDSSILQDLREEKYDTRIKPKSPLQSLPNFIPCTNEDNLLQCVVEDIQNYAQAVSLEKILCIGLKDGMLPRLYQKLTEMGIDRCWAKDAEDNSRGQILLADYMDAKGLERDYVFIVDADHLAIRQNLFVTDNHYQQSVRRDRIKLFIALTRAMREIRLYYINYQHLFIKDLCKLESEMGE